MAAATLTERLVTRLAGGWKRPSRRSFLATAAVGGAALAVNPWDYLTKPQSAYGAVCGPGAKCDEGWSVMCCSINQGKNTCPPGTYAGGWWKADRSSYCGGSARYYIDCNAKPGTHFPCRCGTGSCDQRRVACNVFRYGQCNTQVKGVTAVVCRQISCRPPWELYPGKCSTSSATDNNTAEHTAPCLTQANTYPRYVVFPKAPAVLRAGQSLQRKGRLTSPDRHTSVYFDGYGNLIMHNQRGMIWSTKTAGDAPGGRATMRTNGSFVITDRVGAVVWTTKTPTPNAQPELRLLNSGRLVVLHHGVEVWGTHTHTP